MEKTVQIFHSFADAEKADKEYYQSLSPAELIRILLSLIAQGRDRKGDETTEGLKRVYRVIKRS
jgi:hypothetical protein